MNYFIPIKTTGLISKEEEKNFENAFCYTDSLSLKEKNRSYQRIIKLYSSLAYSFNDSAIATVEYAFGENEYYCCCQYCQNYNDSHKPGELCHHTADLINKFNKRMQDIEEYNDLDERFNLFEEQLREERKKKEISENLRMLNDLLDKSKSEDILKVKELVSLVPSIKMYYQYNELKLFLSLKVGTNKLYIVKNIADLFELIEKKETYSYGKGLSFNHSIDNFTKESRKLIMLLSSINLNAYEYGSRNKYISINPSVLQRVLEIFSGKTINLEAYLNKQFREVQALVLLDNFDLDIEIDDNKLSFKDIQGDPDFMYIPGFEYDFVYHHGIIYKTENDSEKRTLIGFIQGNPDFSLEYIQDEFFKKAYPKYNDNIIISDELRDKYQVYDLEINSYFDYQDEKITLDTKYIVNGEEKNLNDIKNDNINYNKFVKYNSIIDASGFVNNEISDPASVGAFLRADLSKLQKLSTVFLSENIKKMQVKRLGDFKMRLSYNTGMLSVCFEDLNYSNDELYKIIKALKKKLQYVKLNKNTILQLDDKDSSKLLAMVNEFNLDEHNLTNTQNVPLYQSLKLLANKDEYVNCSTDDILQHMLDDIANYKKSDYEVPEVIAPYIRDYQLDAYKWLKTLIKYNLCGILADDMGLGKTLEIISIILSDEEERPSLIVCPKSLAYNWTNEFLKWNTGVKVINVCGLSSYRESLIKSINTNEKVVYVTSYDSLKNDLEEYKDIVFKYMILDEAQFIKNHQTLKAQSVKKIQSDIRFVLTGTPIENTVVDLWSIFDFLMPNYLYRYQDFSAEYEREITQNRNSDLINQLVKKITPFILRRTKKDVLKDLPEKIESIRFAEMSEEQRKIYESELLKTKDYLLSNQTFMLFSCLTRLRELCVDPSLVVENYQGDSAKINLCVDLIKEYTSNNHKILIFSQFTKALAILQEKLKEDNIPYFILTGKTSAIDRVNMANDFNENQDAKVFLISLKAGGTGLNLVGADIVIHLDPWWNVAAENQASDRAHRIGQKQIVQVIKLVCENSIEQKVLELQEIKKQVIKDIISDNDENIVNLKSDDFKFLLS